MQKHITIACLIGSGIIIATTMGIFNSILMFFLMGEVPFTQTVLSPMQMGVILALGLSLIIVVSAQIPLQYVMKKRAELAKSRLPKRRLKQV